MKSTAYYQVEAIRRHIERSKQRAAEDPVRERFVPAGQVKQYVLERMLGIRYRNGGFV